MPEHFAPNIVADETHHPRHDPLFTPETWLRETREVFDRVLANPVGQQVIAAITRPMEIRPSPDSRQENASAAWRGRWTGQRNATPRGERLHSCRDGSLIRGVGPGTGRGSDVVMRYTPWYWWGPGGGVRGGRTANARYITWDDEVFAHELVHAAQTSRGALSCAASEHGYDTFTEFCAVTVENMYMSCTPDRPVRNNHHGSRVRVPSDPNDVLPPTLRDMDEAVLLARFRLLMRDLTDALEGLPNPPVRYNPFRAQRVRDTRALRGRTLPRPAGR